MLVFLIFILFILVLLYSYLIECYRRGWNNIPEVHINLDFNPVTSVSVIVAVRNESARVNSLMAALASQTYPKKLFEVILVDDHSTDDTCHVIANIELKEISFKLLHLPLDYSGKKKALEFGINEASGRLIVTTDADCTFNPSWLLSLVSFYENTSAKFIAAPVKMKSGNTLLNIFQCTDFISMQGITGASVHKKIHAMCNGANIAYEKKAFLEVNGFEGIDNIPSGDDMLLMYKIFRKYPDHVFYLKNRSAIVETFPEPTWKRFLHQRIRWASKAVHYEDKKIFFILLLTWMVNAGFFLLTASVIFFGDGIWLLALLLLMKILVEYPFVNAVCLFFNEQRLMKFFPLLQPFHIMYVIISGWLGRFGSYNWKSRTIKNKGSIKLAKQ